MKSSRPSGKSPKASAHSGNQMGFFDQSESDPNEVLRASLSNKSEGEDSNSLKSKGIASSQAASSRPLEAPLAHRSRPTKLQHFYGQEHLFSRFPFLKDPKNIPSLVLWGPPGTGKTTLASLLAKNSGRELYHFNAVLGGVPELRKLIDRALEMRRFSQKEAIIFIDEIHRFNKAQQDALLPYVESGEFVLFGATTENPRSGLNRALLSRVQILELKKLGHEDLTKILDHALNVEGKSLDPSSVEVIAAYANGDARMALNTLEVVLKSEERLTKQEIKKIILENARDYDKNDNRHYDVISAFIKSLRGSDPDAAILWLAVMLDGGEDPEFIARRLVIFASEDVGNADPMALQVATGAHWAVKNVGMPEARISLAQAVTYLASTFKSNSSYEAINEALEYVQNQKTISVPEHLKNQAWGKEYKYPHNYPDHFIKQEYCSQKLPKFYRPGDFGREKYFKDLFQARWEAPETKDSSK